MIQNVRDDDKRLISWQILKKELDDNLFVEVAVALGNNELKEHLAGEDPRPYCS